MSKESRRVTETKERIRDAFFELYATKKIERISIREITDRAQLNRGTFYVYYKDIYDLLEKTEDELIEEMMGKIRDPIKMILRDDNLEDFLPSLDFYRRCSKYLKVLAGPNGDPNFMHKIKRIVKKNLRELIQEENMAQNEHLEYVLEYLVSAQLGIISYWMIEEDMSLPIPELGAMIKKMAFHGPVGFLKIPSDEAEGLL